MDEPSAAYMAWVSRGFPWREEKAWGADGADGKNPYVGDWGGAAKLREDIMGRNKMDDKRRDVAKKMLTGHVYISDEENKAATRFGRDIVYVWLRPISEQGLAVCVLARYKACLATTPKVSKPGYYAVRKGRVPGIYLSWDECEAQVKEFNGAAFKKFDTEAEANEFMTASPRTARASPVDTMPAASSSRTTSHSTAKEPSDRDVVYCDGACKGNGQPGSIAGIGVWWGHRDPRNLSERCPGDQTNNRAELIAIVRILETAPHLKRPLLIKTDSKYSIQCLTIWIFIWMKNGFRTSDGKPVKNRALIKYLAALLHVRRKTSQTVEFKHVRGHVGMEGNEAADHLANLGATMPSLPERDWERLEDEVLRNLKPVKPTKVVDNDLKAYADGLLSDDELARLSDTGVRNVALPESMPRHGKQAIQQPTSVSLPRASVPQPQSATGSTHNLPSKSKGSTTGIAPLSNRFSAPISKAELEIYASCLLSDDELAGLGRDGVFDSDF